MSDNISFALNQVHRVCPEVDVFKEIIFDKKFPKYCKFVDKFLFCICSKHDYCI